MKPIIALFVVLLLSGCAHNPTCGSVGAAMITGGASCLFKHDTTASD
jgi:hypothetical protein